MLDIDIGRRIYILDVRYRFRKHWWHFVLSGASYLDACASKLLSVFLTDSWYLAVYMYCASSVFLEQAETHRLKALDCFRVSEQTL